MPPGRPGRLLRHDGGSEMTRNSVAVLTALLVAGACQAGGTVKDKDAPTTFATVGYLTSPPPVTACCPPPCPSHRHDHPCLAKFKEWLCFIPVRTCPCECTECLGCNYPLYLYFLHPCVECQPCWHCDNHCGSCVHKTCVPSSNCSLAFGLFRPKCGCSAPCDTCK